MDDSFCLRSFLEPNVILHRRYKALHASFVQRRPIPEIATRFGYTYDSWRQVIHEFRVQCRSGTPPLFLPPLGVDVRPKLPGLNRNCRRWPIATV